jgi:hypothetical protein
MAMLRARTLNLLTFAVLALAGSGVSAQGLIFNLPEDGKMVEYEGTLTQGTSADDESPLSWTCQLTIKSVGRENAEFQGESQPCRWLEIKVLTGNSGAAGLDPGPVGSRIYLVLVPESKITDKPADEAGIPNDMLPIVQGYRRLGEAGTEPIRTSSLRFFPTISLLTSYTDPELIASTEVPDTILPGGNAGLTAAHWRGKSVMESPKVRSTNEADYWVSTDVPFGLARWVVTVTTEEKDLAAARSDFRVAVVKKLDMKLKSMDGVAERELQP